MEAREKDFCSVRVLQMQNMCELVPYLEQIHNQWIQELMGNLVLKSDMWIPETDLVRSYNAGLGCVLRGYHGEWTPW